MKPLSRKMSLFGTKSFFTTYPQLSMQKNNQHAPPHNINNFYFGDVTKKDGLDAFLNAYLLYVFHSVKFFEKLEYMKDFCVPVHFCVAYTTALIIKNETTILAKLMSKISHGFDSRDLSDDNSFMTKTAKI